MLVFALVFYSSETRSIDQTTDHQTGLSKSCRRSYPVTFTAVELTIAVLSISLSPIIKPITLYVYWVA